MPASEVFLDGGSQAIEAWGINPSQPLALVDPADQSIFRGPIASDMPFEMTPDAGNDASVAGSHQKQAEKLRKVRKGTCSREEQVFRLGSIEQFCLVFEISVLLSHTAQKGTTLAGPVKRGARSPPFLTSGPGPYLVQPILTAKV